MTTTPTDIQAIRDDQRLRIAWSDGHASNFDFLRLRASCECAGCVDERTGQRILDPDSIPADISIEEMQLVGNYAVRIRWSDGHSTGLYTWEKLRSLDQHA